MSNEHEISRMEGEGGCMSHADGGEHMDQARAIERLKARLDNIGGGVPLMGREERAIHAILAMATIMRGALDDFMLAGAAVSSDCPPTLDRLLRLEQDIIGAIRGVVIIPVEENVALLIKKCEVAIRDMEQARRDEATRLNGDRYRKLAESVGEPGTAPTAPTN